MTAINEKQPFGTFAPTGLQAITIALARNTFLGRGAARRTTWNALARLRQGPIDARIGGAAFRLKNGPNGTDARLLLNPRYDRTELDFLAEALGDDSVFVDVGANIGAYSLLLWDRVRPIGKIIAIEANPAAIAQLEFNIAASSASGIVVVPQAVGDREAEVDFVHPENNLGAGHVVETGGTGHVRMRPLTAILSDLRLGRCDALKIDIEGFEDRALLPFFRNASSTLWPRRIVMEVSHPADWREDCVAELLRLGYRQRGRTRTNLLLEMLAGTSGHD